MTQFHKVIIKKMSFRMVVTLVYYGLSLSTAQLAGNRYVNGFLNAVVEIPAYTSSYFALKRFVIKSI